MSVKLKAVEKIEILTLQDNYIDLLATKSTEVLKRPKLTRKTGESEAMTKGSLLSEHGFSTFLTITDDHKKRSMLFDFGCSKHGAAFNARFLDLDLTQVEAMALSHGHYDHIGGLEQLIHLTGKKDLELVVHPSALKSCRNKVVPDGTRVFMPAFTREYAVKAGARLKETRDPYPMLDNSILFLGEIPRLSSFEKTSPNIYYQEDGKNISDILEDDTAMVVNVRGQGLVILSGCAHSGIINTINHARKVTGIEKIFAVMGGFHLSGADFTRSISPTTEKLKDMDPDFIVPAHCTGRDAIMHMERQMPEKFLLNMSGTTMVFSASHE